MIFRFVTAAMLILAVPALGQSNPDIDAAARSVVRVVVLAPDETGSREALGMGSGVAISPTRIITNAHVVEAAVERGGFVGIVPSEGGKRYVGEVVAYSAALDLAIVALKSGRITPATIFSGAMPDGAAVAALGYPYGVDRAMASGVDDVIRPQSPVKTLGNVGGRRKNERFDTILHDAAIGRGNSGGPLVDGCGRIVGINSFLSISEGIDSTFAFAISASEVAAFLEKSNTTVSLSDVPCVSQDDVAAREAQLARADADVAAREARRAERDAMVAAAEKARLRDKIIDERENAMAIAALLLAIAVLAIGGGGLALATKKPAIGWTGIALGSAILVAAALTFLMRAKLSDVEDRYAAAHPVKTAQPANAIPDEGPRICTIDPARSRVTVSKTEDVPIEWQEGGCVNGKTQYGANAGIWSRTFVPNGDATVTIQSYDPAKSRYAVARFLLGADAMEKARAIRARYKNTSCTADQAQRQSVAEMETAIRTVLPPTPNERLAFTCRADTRSTP